MKTLAVIALLVLHTPLTVSRVRAQNPVPPAGVAPGAQTSAPPSNPSATNQTSTHSSSITVQSTLVLVPALVKTKSGQLVFTLQASDFTLTDNGVPQKLTLEQDTDSQPLALVVTVETGGDGAARLPQYRNLGALLDAVVGNVPHQIAVVGFDSTPTLLHGFTPNTDFIAHSLDSLDPGDPGDAILDALAFSVDLLRRQPPAYRRAILLLSETIDHGSHTSMTEALRDISDTNTIIYSAGFNSTKPEIGKEARKFGYTGQPPLEPGPEHGCFSRESTGKDENGDPIPAAQSRAAQDFDCLAQLAPPLRLARMAFLLATNSLRQNTAESVARLTGGEYFKSRDVKMLQHNLLTISNHVPNRYVLSFRPQSPTTGFHVIALALNGRPDLVVEARNGYWVEGGAAGAESPPGDAGKAPPQP